MEIAPEPEPEPEPESEPEAEPEKIEYSVTGVAFREPDGRIFVAVDNTDETFYLPGSSVRGYELKVHGGNAENIAMAGGGSKCILYYYNELTEHNVFKLEVYVETAPAEEEAPAEQAAPTEEAAPAEESNSGENNG